MRLRLTVQRHGLPPVRLLWTAGHILPAPYAAAGNSITISQFVEQVNDIIPLESDDWGLEDYAVEVRGFECLHFSEVAQVLKEDDEVCIRPLQTSDIRIRRISGRHQISSDGKHLIDGVAFGRQFLRVVDRPAVRIPPRKRRRLTYGDEEEEEGFDEQGRVNDRQIVVRAGFDDADEATAGDESDDDDFAPDDEDDEDLHGELIDLQRDSNVDVQEGEDGTVRDIQSKSKANWSSRRAARGLGLLALVDENGRPFPGEYENPLLDKYNQDEPSPGVAALGVRKRGLAKVAQSNGEHASHDAQESCASSARISRRSSAGSNKSVRFDDAEVETPATVREFEDSDEDDDSDFEITGINESDKENAEPWSDESDASDDSYDSSDSSSSAFSESQPSASEETSSSGTSSSDTSSDSEPEQRTSKPTRHISGSPQTSSSGSSPGDSDSGSNRQVEGKSKAEVSRSTSQKTVECKASQKHPRSSKNSTLKATEEKPKNLPSAVTKDVPPGEGAQRTRTRNQRRKESKRLAYLKGQGLLPIDATKADYLKFVQGDNKMEKIGNLMVAKPSLNEDVGPDSEFEAKRQALLDSITSGGIDLTRAQGKEVSRTDGQPPAGDDAMEIEGPGSPSTRPDEAMDDAPTNASMTGDMDEGHVEAQTATRSPVTELQKKPEGSPPSMSEPRRSRLDLSSTKRMLFGSLGLRTPKTKEDETKMREQLMKDAKPMRNPRLEKEDEPGLDVEAASADDSWKDKIDLKAVECCHDGIELSTPPFPFVQRWDPQQQGGYSYGNTKKRKQKKRKRNDNSYYEESPYQSSQSKIARHGEFDTPSHASVQNDTIMNSGIESGDLEQEALHDESFEDSLRVSEQLQRETQERTLVEAEDAPDLPSLPKDPSTCQVLTPGAATTGTVIAFKQFEMSANTNWQPRISEYRTAIITEVLAEGSLQIELAKRDQPGKDSQYDDLTGERIYGKFEMPGYDEEDDNINAGQITIPFEELIDPIVVPNAAEHHVKSESPREQTVEHADQDNMDHEDSIQSNEMENSKNKQDNQSSRGISGEIQAKDHSTSQEGYTESLTLRGKHDAASQQSAGFDGAGEVIEVRVVMPSEEARQEISELIRDAGWRSSLGPGVNGSLTAHQDDDVSAKDDQAPANSPSPQFHGFGSSPPYSGIDISSSPLQADIQVARPEYNSDMEVADSVPPTDNIDSDAPSVVLDNKLTIEYPDLPQVGDDSDLFHEEAQHRSNPHNIDHDPLSQDLSSLNGMNQSPTLSTRSRTRLSQESYSPKLSKTLNTSSDEEFPPLFSQAFEARMSQDVEIKHEFSSQEPSISPPTKRKLKAKPKPNGTRSSSQRESKRDQRPNGKWSGLDDDDIDDSSNDEADTPRPSQPPPSSAIVDLTISSDPPHTIYEDDDDDSFVLPSGPGWVKKGRSSGGPRNVPAKANSGRRKTTGR